MLADKSIPEDNRVAVLLFSGNAAFSKKVGMRLFTEGMSRLDAEFETNELDSLHAALKQFPTNPIIYRVLLAVAQRSPG